MTPNEAALGEEQLNDAAEIHASAQVTHVETGGDFGGDQLAASNMNEPDDLGHIVDTPDSNAVDLSQSITFADMHLPANNHMDTISLFEPLADFDIQPHDAIHLIDPNTIFMDSTEAPASAAPQEAWNAPVTIIATDQIMTNVGLTLEQQIAIGNPHRFL